MTPTPALTEATWFEVELLTTLIRYQIPLCPEEVRFTVEMIWTVLRLPTRDLGIIEHPLLMLATLAGLKAPQFRRKLGDFVTLVEIGCVVGSTKTLPGHGWATTGAAIQKLMQNAENPQIFLIDEVMFSIFWVRRLSSVYLASSTDTTFVVTWVTRDCDLAHNRYIGSQKAC